MANKLELTWYGKDTPIRVEPRLLIENAALSNTATPPQRQKTCSSTGTICSPSRHWKRNMPEKYNAFTLIRHLTQDKLLNITMII